ncbi:probable KRE6-glucan synthase subunit [Ustilago bromivora]|nr:probable KRE6-glucan synthase subunit [Ustilago bromivora]
MSHSSVPPEQQTEQRPTSNASSVAIPNSLSFSTSISSTEILDSYHNHVDSSISSSISISRSDQRESTQPPREAFLPYLDSVASVARARNSAPVSAQETSVSRSLEVNKARTSTASPRLTARPFDSPSLAHLSPSTEAIGEAGASAFRTEQEQTSLVDIAIASSSSSNQAEAGGTARTSSNRYSKVPHGLGLFGATSKRKSRVGNDDMKDSSLNINAKGLRIETSIPIEDFTTEARTGTSTVLAPTKFDDQAIASSPSGLHPPRSASGNSPLSSPGLGYKAPTAHHLIGGLSVNHPKGLSSSSSFTSHEERYPATRNDAFSTGLVPILNINDSSSSIYSLPSPRRPYAPGSFTNGPRTPLSATASPTGPYFDEKKLGGSIPGTPVPLSPSIRGDGVAEIKMWGDYDAEAEPDDYLHEPDAEQDRKASNKGIFSPRGILNIGTLAVIGLGLLALFGGYPVISWLTRHKTSTKGGFNLGGINATGQVADLKIGRSLVDPDTPDNVKTRNTLDGTNRKMNLVFSDEFNRDGRSFYPGDDPFWTAMDLHYWGTDNYEWYDPSAVTTANGSLVITLDQIATHNLNFRGGTLQPWNQFCFTGGYIEVAMMMGNLGRAGFGATTDGMWPYTYDSCDVGTLPNQTFANGTGPIAAQTTGVYVDKYGPYLSYLPGQRLIRCTCRNSDDHPGPKHADGSWVGRSAPEIDIIEAVASHVRGSRGFASMSAQIAPFNTGYNLTDTPSSTEFFSPDAELNSYTGSVYQQAASGLVYTKRSAYEDTQATFSSNGFEYNPGSDPDSYILWTVDGDPMWRLNSQALGPDVGTQIGQRPIAYEPMYILLNLGISASFTTVDWRHLTWPATMLVDYVRVWQVEGEENVGCDPENAPTAAYIEKHKEAYYNANLTTWTETRERGGYAQSFPGNSMLGQC